MHWKKMVTNISYIWISEHVILCCSLLDRVQFIDQRFSNKSYVNFFSSIICSWKYTVTEIITANFLKNALSHKAKFDKPEPISLIFKFFPHDSIALPDLLYLSPRVGAFPKGSSIKGFPINAAFPAKYMSNCIIFIWVFSNTGWDLLSEKSSRERYDVTYFFGSFCFYGNNNFKVI